MYGNDRIEEQIQTTGGKTTDWNQNGAKVKESARRRPHPLQPHLENRDRKHFDCRFKKNKRTIETLLISSEQINKKTGDKMLSFHEVLYL